ncbi:MAG: GH1 family beta-glucosidase [Candidatus Microbacterium phytovorans]|uniref:Beta-glucosidase n=1 Tax=Candidatus Microbacterium phytovorans TaxID=3121374 RepID=A0AAJ5W474_9MICO|nr:GH1 family beta-glucosidase [Microbacterium sp.]WEK14431.1 MAG: GH1 family beta-glucosidase [Microbacterium sp.]
MIGSTGPDRLDDALDEGDAVASDPLTLDPSPSPRRLTLLRPPFRWSAATAAFQIEGARSADGRGRSIWDDFVDTPGAVKDGSTAEPGPDSWRRSAEDVALLDRLGVDRYRFSVSWTRVQPGGRGNANRAALDTYSRLVDELLGEGITPFPTLYHWDLPSELEAEGGWLQRETAFRFADFAALVIDALGDRVRHWYTINEPVSTTLQGYAIGELAPARQLLFDALPTVHHQLLAHGLAQQIVRDADAGEVGIVNNHTHVSAATDSADDRDAAAAYDALHNHLFADPLFFGEYPDLGALGIPGQPVHDGDLALIAAPSDFYGVNFYNPTVVGAASPEAPIPFSLQPVPGADVTGFGWPIVPAALTEVLLGLRSRYGAALPPVIVGENGASFPEPSRSAGRIEDTERIAYLAAHIEAIADANERGADVREYTVWSLLDNFEWAEGFSQRFGLVHVDHETSQRTPKASYEWYRALIEEARA